MAVTHISDGIVSTCDVPVRCGFYVDGHTFFCDRVGRWHVCIGVCPGLLFQALTFDKGNDSDCATGGSETGNGLELSGDNKNMSLPPIQPYDFSFLVRIVERLESKFDSVNESLSMVRQKVDDLSADVIGPQGRCVKHDITMRYLQEEMQKLRSWVDHHKGYSAGIAASSAVITYLIIYILKELL